MSKKEEDLKYRRTKKGVITQNYSIQLKSSKERGHNPPNYSNKELQSWALMQPEFHIIYDIWVKNGYKTLERPSFDRLDDYKEYFFDNLRITDWKTNKNKGHSDIKNGINTKISKKVSQYSLDGKFIKTFPSVRIAAREINGSHGNISGVCTGRYKSSYGYLWRYN